MPRQSGHFDRSIVAVGQKLTKLLPFFNLISNYLVKVAHISGLPDIFDLNWPSLKTKLARNGQF